jgi:hypothetical protein
MTDWTGDNWGIPDAALVIAEIDRELGERELADQALVARGRIDPREAEHRARVIKDLRDDLRFAFAPIPDGEILQWCERLEPAATWDEKVSWINRELELREEHYPALVAKGRLSIDDMKKRIEAIKQLRRLYWEQLFMWQPPEGPARDYLDALRKAATTGARVVTPLRKTEGARLYRELIRRHMETVANEKLQQGELAA